MHVWCSVLLLTRRDCQEWILSIFDLLLIRISVSCAIKPVE